MYPIKTVLDENKKEEVVRLVDEVFFGGKKYIANRFRKLFNNDNDDNIYYMENEHGEVQSTASCYYSSILVEGALELKVCSLGAVCTSEKSRGLGLSSRILQKIEDDIRQKDIDILFVSGVRSLYTNRGCVRAGSLHHFILDKDNYRTTKVMLRDCITQLVTNITDDLILDMAHQYNKKPVRFYRSFDEWKELLRGNLFSYENEENHLYLLESEAYGRGYILCRVGYEGIDKVIQLIEMIGNKELLFEGVCKLFEEKNADKAVLYFEEGMSVPNALLDKCQLEPITGTIKLINPHSILEKIKRYTKQYTSKVFEFEQIGEVYRLQLDQKIVFRGNLERLTLFLLDSTVQEEQENNALCLPSIRVDTLNFV